MTDLAMMDPTGYYNRLFLSVDLSGSTEYKYAGRRDKAVSGEWKKVIKDFYQSFPHTLFSIFDTPAAKPNDGALSDCIPEVWKTQGDEIIFSAILQRYQQAAWLTRTFLDVLVDYRNKLPHGLNLKAAGWIADFPERNLALSPATWSSRRGQPGETTNARTEEAYKLDFVGPSMDLGFRLSKYADIDRMAISVELALLLSQAERGSDRIFRYRFSGLGRLKGVLGSSDHDNYPLVFLDTHSRHNQPKREGIDLRLQECEEALHGRTEILPMQIREYCTAFIEKHRDALYEPYFPGCDQFGKEPASYVAWKAQEPLIAELDKRKLAGEAASEAAAADPKETDELPAEVSDLFQGTIRVRR